MSPWPIIREYVLVIFSLAIIIVSVLTNTYNGFILLAFALLGAEWFGRSLNWWDSP